MPTRRPGFFCGLTPELEQAGGPSVGRHPSPRAPPWAALVASPTRVFRFPLMGWGSAQGLLAPTLGPLVPNLKASPPPFSRLPPPSPALHTFKPALGGNPLRQKQVIKRPGPSGLGLRLSMPPPLPYPNPGRFAWVLPSADGRNPQGDLRPSAVARFPGGLATTKASVLGRWRVFLFSPDSA